MGGRTDPRRRRFWIDQRPGYNYGFPFRSRGGYYVTRRIQWAWVMLLVLEVVALILTLWRKR